MAAPLPSDKYCSLYVIDRDSLKQAATQAQYESLWGDFLSAASSVTSRLEKNPWMGKLITADVHDHIWDRKDASSSSSDSASLKEVVSTDNSSHGFSTPTPSPMKGGRTRSQDVSSPVSVLDTLSDIFDDSFSSDTEDSGMQWYQILDAHSVDDVMSRLSLQSLSMLTCVCHGLRDVSHMHKLGGIKSEVLLLRLEENLGKSYEPSTLALPLRITDIPSVQKWDKYSMHANMVSHLYQQLAEALPNVFKYQPSI